MSKRHLEHFSKREELFLFLAKRIPDVETFVKNKNSKSLAKYSKILAIERIGHSEYHNGAEIITTNMKPNLKFHDSNNQFWIERYIERTLSETPLCYQTFLLIFKTIAVISENDAIRAGGIIYLLRKLIQMYGFEDENLIRLLKVPTINTVLYSINLTMNTNYPGNKLQIKKEQEFVIQRETQLEPDKQIKVLDDLEVADNNDKNLKDLEDIFGEYENFKENNQEERKDETSKININKEEPKRKIVLQKTKTEQFNEDQSDKKSLIESEVQGLEQINNIRQIMLQDRPLNKTNPIIKKSNNLPLNDYLPYYSQAFMDYYFDVNYESVTNFLLLDRINELRKVILLIHKTQMDKRLINIAMQEENYCSICNLLLNRKYYSTLCKIIDKITIYDAYLFLIKTTHIKNKGGTFRMVEEFIQYLVTERLEIGGIEDVIEKFESYNSLNNEYELLIKGNRRLTHHPKRKTIYFIYDELKSVLYFDGCDNVIVS